MTTKTIVIRRNDKGELPPAIISANLLREILRTDQVETKDQKGA